MLLPAYLFRRPSRREAKQGFIWGKETVKPYHWEPVERPEIRERTGPAIEALRAQALRLGRLPDQEQAPIEALACISANRVSWPRAVLVGAGSRVRRGRLLKPDVLGARTCWSNNGVPLAASAVRRLPTSTVAC
jgi:hypothetical protein